MKLIATCVIYLLTLLENSYGKNKSYISGLCCYSIQKLCMMYCQKMWENFKSPLLISYPQF